MEVGGLELSLVGWTYMVKSNVRSAASFFSRPFQVLHRPGLLDPHATVLPLETGIHTLGDADPPYGVPPTVPGLMSTSTSQSLLMIFGLKNLFARQCKASRLICQKPDTWFCSRNGAVI